MTKPTGNPRGAPAIEYSEELAVLICEQIANSSKGLRGALKDDPELPSEATVLKWRDNNAHFSGMLAHAKRRQLELMAEDIIDTSLDDTLDVQERRLIVDTKKWLLSKLMPKTYGDKLDVTSGGEALAAPAHQIDARVQSIIMQAHARRAGQVVTLPDEALRLLE